MLEDLDHYILVALVDALNEKSFSDDSDTASVTISSAANYIAEYFEVRIPEEILASSMNRITSHAPGSNWFSVRRSTYATDRYLVNFHPAENIASYYGSEQVYEDLTILGNDWMQESLRQIIQQHKTLGSGSAGLEDSIPASDRYVLRSDNEKFLEPVAEALPDLIQAIEQSNSIEATQKEIALAEIAIFESTICQPRLSVDLIERFLAFCTKSLTVWLGTVATQYIINKLLELLKSFEAALGLSQ